MKTLAGRMVWRRRHYRVRRAKQPGTFNFSVLDNGVISKEYWRFVLLVPSWQCLWIAPQ